MKNIISGLSLLIIFLFSKPAVAQNISDKKSVTGSWIGKINVGVVSLRIVFNISVVENDSLVATLDSPDQGVKNIKLGPVTADGQNIKISAAAMMAEYNGTLKNDTLMEGIWKQAGNPYILNLTKLGSSFKIIHPQEPRAPYPYSSEDITIKNEKFHINLAGTLTIPEGEGPFPAVILITGSGAQNRNEELMGHKPFWIIADYLTRKGIAVLRYDDRGVGKSEGDYASATSADLATDAEAAFKYLKSNSKINSEAIGLAGHSEGGLIAPLVASTNREIAFIISLAGPGIRGEQIILQQGADISKALGLGEEKIRENLATNRKLFAVLKKEKDNDKAEKEMADLYLKILQKKQTSAEETEKSVRELKSSMNTNTLSWFRYFISSNPQIFWRKVKCPVLALNGEKDIQVRADENLTAIEKALLSGGNSNIKTMKLDGLNHLFQHCKTCLPAEYGEIEETFSPEALRIIAEWILNLN